MLDPTTDERPGDERPTSRVQEQGARSRERILDAAEALMADRGYAGTSISAICKESGLPASSVYWHFANKEGLLHAVMERGIARMLDEMETAYAAPGTPRERLHRLLRRAATVFEEHPREFQRLEMIMTLERGQSDPALGETTDRLRSRLRALIEAALYEVFRPLDETLARQAAREGAQLAQMLGDGATLEAIRDPEGFDPIAIIDQAETALLAVGHRRLDQGRDGGAPRTKKKG